MALRFYTLVLFFFLVILSSSECSFFSRNFILKAKAPEPRQWKLKGAVVNFFKPQYVKYSIIGGGSIALFEFIRSLTVPEQSRGILRNIALNSAKTGNTMPDLERILARSLNSTDQMISQRMFVIMKNMQDIEYRLKMTERSVREMEDAYNISMTRFEEFGEGLVDDTDAKITSLQNKMESDISVLSKAVSELRSEVPKLIRQYDQKIMKTIQSLGKGTREKSARKR